ncbi:MAG TPA: hypothetical protein VN778_00455 [Verrucomicrobiae bacterium]|nr:hypothetical protein [Verrucomicrobiae bacterium]
MHQNQAVQEYSFGKITYKVGVDGNIDRPYAVIDHMLATATAVSSVEAIQHGISDSQRDEGKQQQTCKASVEFGEISVTTEISFDLKHHVSRRTLNSLVFVAILPKVWQTAGIYLGDNQPVTTPQSPLAPMPRKDALDGIGSALGLEPLAGFDLSQQQNDQRSRQLVGAR